MEKETAEIPSSATETSPYAEVVDAIAAARAAEVANAQAVADFAVLATQAAMTIPAANASHPIEAILAAQAAEAAAKQSIAQKTEIVSTPPKSQSPSGETGDWTIVDREVKSSNPIASAAPAPSLGARPKTPQQHLVEKAPLHPGNKPLALPVKKSETIF